MAAAQKSYVLVFTNPAQGKEEQFNDWYSNTHIQEVVGVPGFISAHRFQLCPKQLAQDQPYKYLAIYEVEYGKEEEALNNLQAAAATFDMPDVADLDHAHSMIVRSCSELVLSPGDRRES
jgi:hypothetical protein